MELKYAILLQGKIPQGFKLYLYGIEISLHEDGLSCPACSNCTFMELKCYIKIVLIFAFESSNCTFMELKWRKGSRILFGNLCSNCTFMELKSPIGVLQSVSKVNVQIVPLWN